jgi:ectoine hydroxylase-related dioxygenase (phytanoyl-CoA dioxygenase family)
MRPELSSSADRQLAQELRERGFCVVPRVVEPEFIAALDRVSAGHAQAQTPEEAERQRYTGSLIGLELEPIFARLIAHPGILGALGRLGWPHARYMNGYIICKPGGGPGLYWHQDWWGWDHPLSYESLPPMVFAMCYLVDTTRTNGCLRAIPGSHRRRHRLHGLLPEAHTDGSDRGGHDGPGHASADGEVDIAVRAGDLVLGDARVLHATHANRSDRHRTVITMWYIPEYDGLPDSMRREIARQARRNPHSGQPHPSWPEAAEALVAPLRPEHPEPLTPYPWVQQPGPLLA